ncbi:MAG: serine hydrolase domain-containing protein, partial [Achromobacter pestifer]
MTDLSSLPISPAIAQPEVHLPRSEDFLLWPPCLQSYGYRIVDQLFATRTVARGVNVRELPRGPALRVQYLSDGVNRELPEFMDRNNVAGLLVMRQGQVVLERYGLGLQPHDRWSTMSTIKSITALLVGAALQDGAIRSIDDPVTHYLPAMQGCAYEQVTVRHLMTMSSGMEWTEDYT